MGLKDALVQFDSELRSLHRNLHETYVAVVEDRPARNHSLAQVGDVVRDLMELTSELLIPLNGIAQNASYPLNEAMIRSALHESGKKLHTLALRYFVMVADSERNFYPPALDMKADIESRSWAEVVRSGLLRCYSPLLECQRSLLVCWEELAERLSPLPRYSFYSAPQRALGMAEGADENLEQQF